MSAAEIDATRADRSQRHRHRHRAQLVPHVFDRFRQADSGTTRAHGGLGWGLAIVRDLIRLHGGEVEVRSDGVGRGATFTITLRSTVAAARDVERRAKSRKTASLAGHRVVVVEDHDDSRELMRLALENAGAAVAVFDRSSKALDAFEKIRPSALVADIGLPDEDGYDFIRKVRRHSSTGFVQSMPAIAVTAYATVAGSRAGARSGLPAPPDQANRPRRAFQVNVVNEYRRVMARNSNGSCARHRATIRSPPCSSGLLVSKRR
jgi:CheY-like chemotaxis protein